MHGQSAEFLVHIEQKFVIKHNLQDALRRYFDRGMRHSQRVGGAQYSRFAYLIEHGHCVQINYAKLYLPISKRCGFSFDLLAYLTPLSRLTPFSG